MSVFGMICTALCLGYFADVSYTKDGVVTNQATSYTSAPTTQDSGDIALLETVSLPSWWKDDSTDTDGDGIPDLWEKWTHGKKLVADSDLDRDGDGLTDLEEFWNQTDPRTADTDGDGFSDAFEVSNGMNPISSEDFTPVEPDSNNNGLPDIWEQVGYDSSFRDADHNGFDDYYDRYYLPAASPGNFDVLVDVYSTRSALIVWESEENWNSIVLLSGTSTSVKLRLPFGADTELKLLPAPYGTDPPSGELWKSRLRLSFVPRTGQSPSENALISSDGIIAHKVVELESVITRFPEIETMQMLSLDGGTAASGNPSIKLRYRRLGIRPIAAAWHFVDELIGPFSITNLAGVLPQSVSWSADYGSMAATPNGMTAFLTITQAPPPFDFDTVTITAVSELDEATFVTNKLAIPKCGQSAFGLIDATENFSPHLGETASFTLDLTGCPHHYQEGWLEGELMRETTAGWQHVGWLDASQAQPGHQKRRHCLAGPQTIVWDGIATEGAALVDSPDVFTNAVSPFHRALPQVVSGEPVPPPYYTIFFRYREADSDRATILDEASTKVYVPQVVRIEMTDAAYNEFKTPIIYPETFSPHLLGKTNVVGCLTNILLYAGCPDRTKAHELDSVVWKCQTLVPSDVNLKFTRLPVTGRCKQVVIIVDTNTDENFGIALGYTPNECVSWPNADPEGICYAYVTRIRKSPCTQKYRNENNAFPVTTYDSNLFPFTSDEQASAVASVATHETGHTLGLVEHVLYGSKGKHNQTTLNNGWMMNASKPFMQHYGKPTALQKSWEPRNHEYLRFILPKN